MRLSYWRVGVVAGAAALLVPMVAAPASAHVTANPEEADSEYFRTALRVGHGCEGSPTTEVRVQIPEGVESPRPEVVSGWETELVHEELDEPVEGSHGEEITERVAEIAWTGGNLSDDSFQEFGLSFRITEDAPEVLWFPTIQACEEGEHRWIDIPPSVKEWGELDEPAPYVINALAGGQTADGADAASAEEGDEAADAEQAAVVEDDSGTDPLTVLALIAGLLGVGGAVGAFVYASRRTAPASDRSSE